VLDFNAGFDKLFNEEDRTGRLRVSDGFEVCAGQSTPGRERGTTLNQDLKVCDTPGAVLGR